MGWEFSDVAKFGLWPLLQISNDGSLVLLSCLSGGSKFASVLRCTRSSYMYFYIIVPFRLTTILPINKFYSLITLSGYCFHPWCLDGRVGGGKKFVRVVSQKP